MKANPMDDAPLFTRRQTLALAAAVVASPAQAQEPAAQAQGQVFDEAAGTGISGVLVSNGRDIVRTDVDGHYRLPVRDGDSVFVIKPTGWMTPFDPRTHLPRFSYIFQPDGTPNRDAMRFAGVAPTGPLPPSIDFPLHRQGESTKFDVLLFTDPQPESAAELEFVRDDVVALAGQFDTAFGITTGDIMFDDLSLYGRSNRIVGTLGRPWYCCPGNHDMNLDASGDATSRETYKRVFGARHFAFQYGGATFVMLDNVEYLGNLTYRGHIGADQLGFLRALLALLPPDQLVVVCMHIPLRTLVGDTPNVATIDTQDFLAVLGDRPNVVSFSGHTHTNEHHYLGDRQHHHHVLSAVSGSWWSGPFDVRGIPVTLASDGAPNGFHILSIDGAACSTRLVPAHEAGSPAMRLMLEAELHADKPEVQREYRMGQLFGASVAADGLGSARLLVNLFDGGPRSTVAFTVGDAGNSSPMQRVERIDPFVQEVYARNLATKKPWVEAGRSSHLWQARLPETLPAGTHRIRVQATDEFGRRHTAAMVLEVV
jgi:hypothetical protein